MSKITELFNKHEGEFLKFDRVEFKLSSRPDVHAIIMLDNLTFNNNVKRLISCAEHDQIWFAIDLDELEKVISEQQVIDLIRCGIFIEEVTRSLTKYV